MVRLRNVLSAALAVGVGATLLTACSSDPTPSKVTVAWADSSRQAVQVSWHDSGAPNRITIEGVLSTNPSYVKYLAGDDPNTWAIPASAFPPDGNYKVSVGVGTSTGGMSSKLASSPIFDTNGPVRPGGATATPTGKRDVLVRWTVPPEPQDFSPGDPLDVTGKTQLYVPVVGRPGQPLRSAGAGTTSTRQVLKNLKPPYVFQLRAQNEWSTAVGGQISARTSSTSATVPALAQFGVPIRIRGRTILQQVVCADEGSCVQQRTTSAGLPLVVLTQLTPGARWKPTAWGTTTSGGHYDIAVATGGSRPYKVVLPDYSVVGQIAAQSASKPQLTRTIVKQESTGFLGGAMKKRGETVTAILVVKPAMRTTVMLQSWNRKLHRWNNVKAVPMRKGQAAYAFKVVQPGIYVFRFVIPNVMLLGRPMLGKVTQNLSLSVR
ncbi:fibronectin type III domain-containing protein [Streptomyces sp. SID13031]|uniref:fibronectin type III domain-containing protein n=1 Tax=Streptomyces sp. SID13031 TaxID=2706046 RepID=UPI0013C5A434|nr:fibronectin type III domain-containing protein [Streptomyces sp. SID13031]NEA34486.1 fibronectin type III domain-containing protein [Streptomyces sp. SID13031]